MNEREFAELRSRHAVAARRRAKWLAAGALVIGCSVYADLFNLVHRHLLHRAGSLWGGAYLTLGLWWLIGFARLIPKRVDESTLSPTEFSQRLWVAYRRSLGLAVVPVTVAFLVLDLLHWLA